MTEYHQRTFPLRKSSSRNSGEFGGGAALAWRQSNEELETSQKRKSMMMMEEIDDKGKIREVLSEVYVGM